MVCYTKRILLVRANLHKGPFLGGASFVNPLLFMFGVCHAFLSVHCSLVVTCCERADLLALLCVMFYCVFVTFPCGVLGQVWYCTVLIPDLCLLTYFIKKVFIMHFVVLFKCHRCNGSLHKSLSTSRVVV